MIKQKLLFTFALLLTAATGAWADGSCGGGLTWTLSSGTLTISKTSDGTGAMTEYDWEARPWHSQKDAITSVVIGNGVTSISQYAFYGCSNLASLTIGNNLETIGVWAFNGCTNLTSVILPASMTSIGADAFYGCSNLSTVIIKATSLTGYGGDAFYGNKSGRKIYVPANSANTYKAGWPAYASDIIGYQNCGETGHESDVVWAVTGESTNKTLFVCGTGAMAGYNANAQPWYSDKNNITSVVIGDGVTGIGKYAFDGYSHITSLTIGNDLATIDNHAFSGCSSLKSVILPASLMSIGADAFYGCSNLSTVVAKAASLSSYGVNVFINNASGRKIFVPAASVDTYKTGWSAYANDIYGYQNCGETGHESDVVWAVTGESTNKTLFVCGTGAMAGYNANAQPWYSDKNNITSVVIGDGVTGIGKYAFDGYSHITSLTIGNDLATIGVRSFADCSGLSSVILPATMTKIEDSAFYGCSNLSTVIVRASSVPTCQNNAFWGNKEGRKIYVPATSADTYKTTARWSDYASDIIGYYGTGGPTGHTNILHAAVPATCTTAGNSEYWECIECHKYFSDENGEHEIAANSWVTAATGHNMTAHAAVAATCTTAGNSAYWSCSACGKYFSDSEGTNEIAENTWVIPATGHSLIAHAAVAATCTTAGNSAYWSCSACGKYFSDSEGTNEIAENTWVIPATGHILIAHAAVAATCTTAGNSAYWECTVCHKYFSDDAGTTEITENSWVIAAHHNVVNNICTGCGKYGYCGTSGHASDVTWELTGDSPNYTLHISGTGAMADYSEPGYRPWNENRAKITSVVIGDEVTSIGNNAFNGCENLPSVTIPASVKNIGEYAFNYCNASVTFAANSTLETIHNYAFYCSGLTSITLPASVKSIGHDAFSSSSNLTSVTLNSNPKIGSSAFADITPVPTVTMNLPANSVGSDYWMTFYNDGYHFKADENTKVYKGTLSGNSISLTEVADKIVTAGTAVILKSTGNPVMTLNSAASSDTNNNNNLQGVSDLAGITAADPSTTYVLNYKSSTGVGFYKLKSGKTLGYGKAYLDTSTSAPNYLNFEEDETTGIMAIDNGQLTMDNDVFDMQGRRVQNPTKGLYIVNGKKVVIK